MAEMRFFPNGTGKECFRSALANLLLVLGDADLAQRAYDAYPLHPRVQKEGVLLRPFAGIVASDLVGPSYRVQLLLTHGVREEYVGQEYDDGAHAIELLCREQATGRMTVDEAFQMRNAPLPAVMFGTNGTDRAHAVVALPDGLYIDNGFLKDEWPQHKPTGLLEVRRIL